MKPVGVRELKAHLSEYLRRAAAGETILVSDRKRQPFVKLAPVTRSADSAHLEELERAGLIQRGQGRPGQRPGKKKRSRRSVAGMVVEDRR
jgi:prevent-host-death family protein